MVAGASNGGFIVALKAGHLNPVEARHMRDPSTYRADLIFVKLRGGQFDKMDFRDVHLEGAGFHSSALNEADFREAYCAKVAFNIADNGVRRF